MFRNYNGHLDAPVIELAGVDATSVRNAAQSLVSACA
jgi:hypothetical protein